MIMNENLLVPAHQNMMSAFHFQVIFYLILCLLVLSADNVTLCKQFGTNVIIMSKVPARVLIDLNVNAYFRFFLYKEFKICEL